MSDWISVEDSFPDQGEIVDVWATVGRITSCWWDKESPGSEEWFWATTCQPDTDSYGVMGGVMELAGITHWMPLPDPPNE